MSQLKNSLTEMELDAVIHAGCFKSKEEVVNEALGTLFALRPELKLEAAIELYKEDKVTLSRAAEIAGLAIWRFKDILVNRSVSITSPSFSKEELDKQIEEVSGA
ncbi:UPF0175 family protein [bacterium]|nr:UPF0175 family protein [bacterium]MBU1782484.1 UPF0175 family protein [bacterium]